MDNRQLIIDAPTPGFTSVLVTACDEANCVERILDLEVRALAELYVEEIRIDEEVRAEIYSRVKVFVRNSGQVQATMIGVGVQLMVNHLVAVQSNFSPQVNWDLWFVICRHLMAMIVF